MANSDFVYTDERYDVDEDGFRVKMVYVPLVDEWMTEDLFWSQKRMYDASMDEAREYYNEQGMDDNLDYTDPYDEEDVGDIDDNDDNDEYDPEYYKNMTREEAMAEYERTGINHSEHDLNDWDDINRRLGFEFFKPRNR